MFLQGFNILSLTFTHELLLFSSPAHFLHFSCPLITLRSLSSLPRNHRISIYHMWASLSWKKQSLTSFCFGEDLIAQSPYGQTVISYIYLSSSRPDVSFTFREAACAIASVSACCFCSNAAAVWMYQEHKKCSINPQVASWWLCVQVDECCYKATIAPKGSMGNRRAFRERCVCVSLKADSIYPKLLWIPRDMWVGKG